MNTNGNVYTIIYSTIIVVFVSAILAFASMSLKPRQDANEKAETISQMLTAAGLYTKEALSNMSNDKVLEKYAQSIRRAFLINIGGSKIKDLNIDIKDIELANNLKAQNKLIKSGAMSDLEIPVYIFEKDGKEVSVFPIYGAGLWGPIWGYIAFDEDLRTIIGAYFDHESETPGLGAKIKDEPSFRSEFKGKRVDFTKEKLFEILKGVASSTQENAIDAITGATMTSKGLEAAINTWMNCYKGYINTIVQAKEESIISDNTIAIK